MTGGDGRSFGRGGRPTIDFQPGQPNRTRVEGTGSREGCLLSSRRSREKKKKKAGKKRIHIPRIKTRIFITVVNNATLQSGTSKVMIS